MAIAIDTLNPDAAAAPPGTAPRAAPVLSTTLEVRLDGRSISAEPWGQVTRIEIEDDLGLPGAFTIEIAPSAELAKPSTWLDDDRQFALGARVEVLIGVHGARTPVLRGEITALEPQFSEGSEARLNLRGYDARHRLQRGTRTRSFQNVTDSDVVTQIAQAAGIEVDAGHSGLRHDYLVQANQSDLDFLNARAEAIDHELLMIDGRLVFRPSGFDAGAAVTLRYGNSLKSLHFSLSVATQPTQLAVRAWSVANKEPLIGDAAVGSERSRMGGKRAAAAEADQAFGAAEAAVVMRPAASQAEVDAHAGARYARAGLQLLSVEGLSSGHPGLRAGSVVAIEGVGPRYGGLYYLHSVSHRYSLDRGYETRFEGRRNAL
ncbi:phage late control D family protein [Nevskia sp.]|uniref:phage late control D family protein n=1 Tax=Nevskia sp. TaxID=1929292 RepID=UPI0025F50928|nr:contractile injection system protein, VgrG/Pvc8 family [Nevskia sp.]